MGELNFTVDLGDDNTIEFEIVTSNFAKGGFGHVDIAEAKREVILKYVAIGSFNPKLMMREAILLTRLSHRNIVRIYNAWMSPDCSQVVLELEYCKGGTLRMEISERNEGNQIFLPLEVNEWILQLGQAINYIHDLGIAHRDIKPANVFFTSDKSTVKLGDFGGAKMADSKSDITYGAPFFTPGYLSPEMVVAHLRKGIPIENLPFLHDIWAFGVVLHQIATLTLPFPPPSLFHPLGPFQSLQDYFAKERRPETPINPKIWSNCGLKSLVEDYLLTYDPKKRASAAEMMKASFFTSNQATVVKQGRGDYLHRKILKLQNKVNVTNRYAGELEEKLTTANFDLIELQDKLSESTDKIRKLELELDASKKSDQCSCKHEDISNVNSAVSATYFTSFEVLPQVYFEDSSSPITAILPCDIDEFILVSFSGRVTGFKYPQNSPQWVSKVKMPAIATSKLLQINHATVDALLKRIYFINFVLSDADHSVFSVNISPAAAYVEASILIDFDQLNGRQLQSINFDGQHRILYACDSSIGLYRDVSIWSLNTSGVEPRLMASVKLNSCFPDFCAFFYKDVDENFSPAFHLAISDLNHSKIEVIHSNYSDFMKVISGNESSRISVNEGEKQGLTSLGSIGCYSSSKPTQLGSVRWPQEMAFDEYGNLFVIENHSEQKRVQVFSKVDGKFKAIWASDGFGQDCDRLAILKTSSSKSPVVLVHSFEGTLATFQQHFL